MAPFADLGRVRFVLSGDPCERLVQKLGPAACSPIPPALPLGCWEGQWPKHPQLSEEGALGQSRKAGLGRRWGSPSC